MVKQSDILKAVNCLLVAAYPDYTVYVQDCPKDFERPSFLLEYIRLSQSDASRSSVEKTVYFTITGFIPTDRYYRSDMDALADLQDGILKLFLPGYVTVGDRAIRVQASTGGTDTDRAYIDVQFNFFDNREADAQEDTPLIASVSTRIGGINFETAKY